VKGVALSAGNFLSSMNLQKNFLGVINNTKLFPPRKISWRDIHSLFAIE
jgi:hypothetical protein